MVSGRNDRSQCCRCRAHAAGPSTPQWCPVGTTGVSLRPVLALDTDIVASMVSGRNDRSQLTCSSAAVLPAYGGLNGVRSERPESDGSEDLNLRCHTLASM